MSFSKPGYWVWDFWLADDGERHHLFYLHAPRSLGDESLRHRNARIGHATSTDLRTWEDHGVVLSPGPSDAFDATATWTGSVVRGPDGLWRMFYTGARFLGAESNANVESIGVATSPDLFTWTKRPGPVSTADPRWYETLADGTWREEAWRDPWVFPAGDSWHMLVTARGIGGGDDRGVIGHAVSPDLEHWTVRPPVSAPGAGFAHVEVPQLVDWDGRMLLVFSCDTPALAGALAGGRGGVWAVEVPDALGPYPVEDARLLVDDTRYAGRVVADRDGQRMLLAFENVAADSTIGGVIADPIPLDWPIGAPVPTVRVEAAAS